MSSESSSSPSRRLLSYRSSHHHQCHTCTCDHHYQVLPMASCLISSTRVHQLFFHMQSFTHGTRQLSGNLLTARSDMTNASTVVLNVTLQIGIYLLEVATSVLPEFQCQDFIGMLRKCREGRRLRSLGSRWCQPRVERVVLHSIIGFDGTIGTELASLSHARDGTKRISNDCHNRLHIV
jgi:hypothetical protein